MKDITAVLKTSDEIEERIRMLTWVKDTFLTPQIAKGIALLRADCGFNDAPERIQQWWAVFEVERPLRQTAEILLQLRALGASIEYFFVAYCSREGGTVSRALALLNPRMKCPSVRILPIEWQN